MKDFDISLEVLEKLDIYWNPPKNCTLEIHQSIMRKLYHCDRVIRKANFSINFK